MDPTSDPELEAAVDEELAAATTLSWRELSRLVPWGDSHEGFGPSGGYLVFERSYIWAEQPGGDILCEVAAFRGASRYERASRRSLIIKAPR